VTNRFDEYGSLRNSATLNQEIIPGVLAIRLAVLQDDEKFEQSDAFNNQNRYYGAFRFDPKLFGKDSHTSIRATTSTASRPRTTARPPPTDEITPWFTNSITIGGVTNPGYNKLTENQFSLTNTNPSGGPALPGGSGGPLSSAMFQLGGWSQGRSYWADVVNYFEATPASVNSVANASHRAARRSRSSRPRPIRPRSRPDLQRHDYGANSIGGISSFRPDAIPPFSLYAGYVGTQGANANNGIPASYRLPTNPIPGGVYYTDKVITDSTIFNFYKKLLDGPNKHEWKNWTAFNIAIDQTFFDDRVGFEFAYDQQKYTEGAEPWLEGENYAIASTSTRPMRMARRTRT